MVNAKVDLQRTPNGEDKPLEEIVSKRDDQVLEEIFSKRDDPVLEEVVSKRDDQQQVQAEGDKKIDKNDAD